MAGVLYCLGWTMLPFSLAMLLPAMAAMIAGDEQEAVSFLGSALLGLFVAGITIFSSRRSELRFDHRAGYLYIVLLWPAVGLIGALPFFFGDFPGTPLDGFFESLSAVTTTGISALGGEEALSPTVLLWRGLLQWLGGFLTVVLSIVVLLELGVGGIHFFQSALARGESEHLPQRLVMVALNLSWVYLLLTFACSGALWLSGASSLGGIGLAMAAISTGGFIMGPVSEVADTHAFGKLVLLVFMLTGAINLTLAWAFLQGRVKPVLRNVEFQYFVIVLTVVGVVLAGWMMLDSGHVGPKQVFSGFLVGASLLTTSGLALDPAGMSALPAVAVIALLLVGGCAGSTAGGMKIFRVAMLFKQGQRELERLSHPHGVVLIKARDVQIDNSLIQGVWSYFFGLVVVLAVVSISLAAFGMSDVEAIGMAVAAITNAGPAADMLAPSLGPIGGEPLGVQIVIMVTMVLGRLEIIAFFAILNPEYWRR
jgi:trk system potassium uptake protein TrkH